MQKRLLVASALIAVGYFTGTLVFAQQAATPAATANPSETAKPTEAPKPSEAAKKPADPAKKPADTAKKPPDTGKKPPTLATRTATCKSDCKSGNVHGAYRSYNTADPNLISPEGQKMYAECVNLCLAPLPSFHIWKAIIDNGGAILGKWDKAFCMTCHAPGETKGRSAGAIMVPNALRREESR